MKKFFFIFFFCLSLGAKEGLHIHLNQEQVQNFVTLHPKLVTPIIEDLALRPFSFEFLGQDISVLESNLDLTLSPPKVHWEEDAFYVQFETQDLQVRIHDLLVEKDFHLFHMQAHCYNTVTSFSAAETAPLQLKIRPYLHHNKIELDIVDYQYDLNNVSMNTLGPDGCSSPVLSGTINKVVRYLLENHPEMLKEQILQQMDGVLHDVKKELSKRTHMFIPISGLGENKKWGIFAHPKELSWDENFFHLTYALEPKLQSDALLPKPFFPIFGVDAKEEFFLADLSLHQNTINKIGQFFFQSVKSEISIELTAKEVPDLDQILNRPILEQIFPQLKKQKLDTDQIRSFLRFKNAPPLEFEDEQHVSVHLNNQAPALIIFQIKQSGEWKDFVQLSIQGDLQFTLTSKDLEGKEIIDVKLSNFKNMQLVLEGTPQFPQSTEEAEKAVLEQMVPMILKSYERDPIIHQSSDKLFPLLQKLKFQLRKVNPILNFLKFELHSDAQT